MFDQALPGSDQDPKILRSGLKDQTTTINSKHNHYSEQLLSKVVMLEQPPW